ncbi:uncharacterized protein LOC8038126 isoform X1 [Ixodes scapularis]|uniref:uncharacterized protein LOC8038126 isoform X1 n=1 Tax=Ixodes scapularis TaxID=6945 RepID=UPI001C383C83|nr:uncharacterized protein LOC8038126 isoform X1 [Ixodes scapularis]
MTALLLVEPPGEQYKYCGWLRKFQFLQYPKATTTMLKFILTALVAYLVVAAADHHEHEHHGDVTTPACGENEVAKTCVSSSCAEATCDKPQIGPQCTLDCQTGCYCDHGFFRNGEHGCVTKEACPEGSAAHTYVEPPHAHE